jgi:hypothetical protein
LTYQVKYPISINIPIGSGGETSSKGTASFF